MMYQELDSKLQGRCRESRKVGNNTYLIRHDDYIAVRLHNTEVVRAYPNGDIILDSGGWHTPTTKDRMNQYVSNRIWQEAGRWYLRHDGKQYLYADRVIKAEVSKYAKLCADSVPLPQPAAGDCFYCHMQTTDGESLGDAVKDVHHLKSHMIEGYVVPSLVYNALKAHYNAPMALHQAFEDTGWTSDNRDFGKLAVRKAVYRYMLRRFGFAI